MGEQSGILALTVEACDKLASVYTIIAGGIKSELLWSTPANKNDTAAPYSFYCRVDYRAGKGGLLLPQSHSSHISPRHRHPVEQVEQVEQVEHTNLSQT